jgi:membrane-bound metal-dependent hydrolase YbcI (DUF457 family)
MKMPGYRGHIGGGVIAFGALYMLVCHRFSLPLAFEWLIFTLLGALFPDVDIKSKGRTIFYKILLCIAGFLLYKQRIYSVAWVGILGILPLFLKHRGLSHSLLFLALVSVSAIFISMIYLPSCAEIIAWDAFFFFAGAVSHIVLDFGFLKTVGLR